MRNTFSDDLDVLNIFHLHVESDGPYEPADLVSVADVFATAYSTDFLPVLCTALVHADVTAKDISVVDGAVGLSIVHAGDTGAISSQPAQANCALVISWKESLSYRGGHPRTYLCGWPMADASDGQHVNGTYAASVQTHANTFLGDINAATYPVALGVGDLAVVHYRLNDAVQTPPLVKPILAATVNTRTDSQRRRLQK